MIRSIRVLSLLALTASFLAFGPLMAMADVTERAAADFRPLAGVIIMPIGDEFLIDLDMNSGVVQGDLFSVVVRGERVIHPVTKEVLGTLDEVKAVLQVTRIKSGYSYVRALQGGEGLKKGDAVRRYANVPAAYWDYTGQGQALFAELRTALPELEWQGYEAAQAQRPPAPQAIPGETPILIFIRQAGKLEVRGKDFQVLRSYALHDSPAPQDRVSLPVPAAPGIGVPPVPSGIVAAAGGAAEDAGAQSGGSIIRAERQDSAGIWVARELKGDPIGLEVGDFDGDGRQEHAVLYRDKLEIARLVDGGTEVIATLPQEWVDKYLTMDSVDLDGDGVPELYITAVSRQEPASLVCGFRQGRFQILQHSIPFYLRKVHVSGEGEVLLGQRMGDLATDFASPIFRVRANGGKLEAGAPISTPWGLEIFGFTTISGGAGGDRLFTALSRTGRLQVKRADGDELWESSQPFGGSKLAFERRDQSGGAGFGMRTVPVKPRLEVGEGNTVLVPLNESGGIFSVFTELGPSRVVAMGWSGRAMRELWHTRPQDGYLADFRYADIDNDGAKELAMIVVASRPGILKEGRASLVVYEVE